MVDCYYCKAKEHCTAAAEPGSVVCMVNRMRYGGTAAICRLCIKVKSR